MAGARLSMTLDSRDYTRRVEQLGGVLKTGVVRAIGSGLVGVTQERFETETSPLGPRWEPLNPAYAAIRRGGNILSVSGLLNRTMTFETSGSSVMIGSNRVYAGVQNFGAVIVPKNGKGLAFKLGKPGKNGKMTSGIVFAKSVRIPSRPFLGFGPKDYREVVETLDFFIMRTLSG